MICSQNFTFQTNSIIDLVIFPRMKIAPILAELTSDFHEVFILDTQGELHLTYGKYGWSEEESSRIKYAFVSVLDELQQRLQSLWSHSGFVLVIDSVTFVCDTSALNIQAFSAVLWDLIYTCNATVITVNHYRLAQLKGVFRLVPRMGDFWRHIVTYQVEFSDPDDARKYKLLENRIDQI